MAGASDYSRKIVLTGVPIAWVLECYEDTGVQIESSNKTDAVTADKFRFLFDNLKEIQYKIVRTAAAEGAEKVEVERADGAVIEFPKVNVTIDGETELVITAAEDEQTGLAEITLITNEADMDSATPTEMQANLRDAELRYFLICIPTGFTYDSRNEANVPDADGFAYMFGKISSNIEVTNNSGVTTYTITFAAVQEPSGFSAGLDAALQAFSWTGLPLKPTSLSITITPETITATEAALIVDGKMGLIPSSLTYT